MNTLYWIIGVIIIAALGWFAWGAYQTPAMQPTPEETAPITITPIEHATLVMDWDGTVVYVDPTDAVQLAGQPRPAIVLVTDIHGDHLSTSTLETIAGSSTLVVPQAVYDLLPASMASSSRVLANGQSVTIQGLTITAVPMYNLPESPESRHTKGRGNGYIVEQDGYRVYVAGDTAGTPEMRALKDIDVAFVPMNLPFTMGVEEAADATLAFAPKSVYPYHYRGQDGLADVDRFKELVTQGNPNINVILADWYPGQ